MERRLAAILAADVVGYSRLMERNEAGTYERLRVHREELFEPEIAQHHGRIFKRTGDGLLAEFVSVVEAVECAAALQRGMSRRNSGLPDDQRIEVRIGLHVGDVIVDDGDRHGDAVNVAARLQQLAEPGGICVSRRVVDHVGQKVALGFEWRGEERLRNMAAPVSLYRVQLDRTISTMSPIISEKPSIAVLPLANLSGDPEQEYFADGITEEIITALSYMRSFPVIARNSSFAYKGRSVRIQQVAQELGVTYVLEGSVRRAGSRVRVTAQLVDAITGHHIWVHQYDRPMDDVFEIQDDITLRIALALQPELAEAELKRTRLKRPESLTAWDNYLQGTGLLARQTCADNSEARRLFQRAIEHDPNFGEAWAALGWSHLRDYDFKCTEDLQGSLDQGLDAAQKGVMLDDSSAFTHYVLSTAYVWREQLSLSLAELERTLELNPFYARAHLALGNRLELAGHAQEGIARLRRALELNPRDPERHTYLAFLSRALVTQGEYEEACQLAERAVGLSPQNPDMLYRLAACLAHLDRVEEAREVLERCERIRPDFVAKRRTWRPYNDDARNTLFFAGMDRHGLR